jgi:hypothetical protein
MSEIRIIKEAYMSTMATAVQKDAESARESRAFLPVQIKLNWSEPTNAQPYLVGDLPRSGERIRPLICQNNHLYLQHLNYATPVDRIHADISFSQMGWASVLKEPSAAVGANWNKTSSVFGNGKARGGRLGWTLSINQS